MAQDLNELLLNCPVAFYAWEDDCTATAVVRCPDGGFITLDRAVPPGDEIATRFTSDGDVLFAFDVGTGDGVGLRIETRDPFSIAEMRANSADTFDNTHAGRFALPLTRDSRVWGEGRLDGGSVMTDGRRLLTGSYVRSMKIGPGGPVVMEMAELFLDPEMDVILLGREQQTMMGTPSGPMGGSPVRFFNQGEPGFDDAFDLDADCEPAVSSLVQRLPHG